jgi:nucleotide-binding universal stress UspA family protein
MIVVHQSQQKGELMFRKILVPLDGSDLAAQILPQVEELAKTLKSEITLITVGSLVPFIATVEEFSYKSIDEFAAVMKKESEKKLDSYVAKMKAKGLNVNGVYIEGVAAPEIIAYAAKNNFDLIAMATHGRGEIAWVLGSVAEKVVSHATVPVLLMRVLAIKQPVSKKDYADSASLDDSEMPA